MLSISTKQFLMYILNHQYQTENDSQNQAWQPIPNLVVNFSSLALTLSVASHVSNLTISFVIQTKLYSHIAS